MGKTKDSNLALLEPVDTTKPVVKDFIDHDMKIKTFILSRLPHVSRSTVTVKKVYESKNNHIHRYRINYHRSEHKDDQLVPTNSIVASKYIEVTCKGKDMMMVDKTG